MEHPLRERIAQLEERRREALQPGSKAAIQRQHDRGKMLARERIEYLLDDGSFHELDMLARHRNPAIVIDDRDRDGVLVEGIRIVVCIAVVEGERTGPQV